MTTSLREKLIGLIEPLLVQLRYELVDLEYVPGRSQAVLRVFIDREPAVDVDDCEQVSREISALLDVEDPVPTAYALEVSSPGLDRVLRIPAHFERFVGERIHVELTIARDGRRRYTGRLATVQPSGVQLEVDGTAVNVPFVEIARARLAPMWPEATRRK